MTTRTQITAIECIKWMILGIKNGSAEAAKDLGEDFIKQYTKAEVKQNDEQ